MRQFSMFDTARGERPLTTLPGRPLPVDGGPGGHPAIVVGAGWAGLAAAVGLAQAGCRVTLLDAAPRAGGRARSVELAFDDLRVEVDNGQHLLIGAYRSTLAMLERIGTPPATVLERSRLRLQGPQGLDLRAAALPAPLNLAWGLLRARGLPMAERIAMMRLTSRLRLRGPQDARDGETVSDWLERRRQPPGLQRRIWIPLCVGALNTPPARACARTFAQVLCDALLARASDADFLLPRTTLGDVLPGPALAWLRTHGADVRLRSPCRSVVPDGDDGWFVETGETRLRSPRVVLAVPPRQVRRLLGPAIDEAAAAALDAFEHEPIATVWLGWRTAIALPAMTMLEEDPGRGEFGQWLFRRAPGSHPGLAALAGVVISAAGRDAERPEPLARAVAAQVSRQLRCPPPTHARAIIEREATIRCSPGRPRTGVDLLSRLGAGIAVAGDWCWPRYPATLESAVRSGEAAAHRLLERVPLPA